MRLLLASFALLTFGGGPAPPPDHASLPIVRHAIDVLPSVAGPAAPALLVVIDPGHGGRDPGSTAADGGVREKDVTLATGLAIREALLAGGGVRVALTRADDRALYLSRRREIARALGADLLISIHCDSARDPAARGASIYTLAERSSDIAAAATAARENAADRAAGGSRPFEADGVPSILTDLARRETRRDAAAFAHLLGQALSAGVRLRPSYLRQAALIVLKAPDVPSVLIETGYLSNPADLARLRAADYRRRIAHAVASALRAYVARGGRGVQSTRG